MALPPIYPLLLIAVIKSCNCDGYNPNYQNPAVQIGELLKPPPPPPVKNLLPVPFHNSGKEPRHTWDHSGYNYQPPPPLPPNLKNIAPSNLKIPSGFHKQYNFNFSNNNYTSTYKFVPPPPLTTTQTSNVFQKVSGWLFSPYAPHQTTSAATNQPAYNYQQQYQQQQSIPKECNPCNLIPWMPVIRYNTDLKNTNQNVKPNFISSPYPSTFTTSPLTSSSLSTPSPTYGPPSPTAFAHHAQFNQDIVQFYPKPFQSSHQSGHLPSFTPSISHAVYGHTLSHSFLGAPAHSDFGSTYGPPSPTHTVAVPSHSPPTSTLGDQSSTFPIPSSYGVPSQSPWEPSPSYAPPISPYDRERLNPTYGPPSAQYGLPLPFPKSPPSTPEPLATQFNSFDNSSPSPDTISSIQETTANNNDFSLNFNFDDIKGVSSGASQYLPKVEHPASFKNSYGQEINPSDLEVLFPVSATAAASIKIKTQVFPNATNPKDTNQNLVLSNPAPFTLNRGRNIHTLQPVALPNLSVSPLPPIFNARPFRPPAPKLEENIIQKLNSMQNSNNVKIQQSLPIAEFIKSIDYPPKVIQSQVIDIDDLQKIYRTKAYRNIYNPHVVDHVTDISSQASEEHTSATKVNQDISFESTGTDFVNDISNDLPMDLNRIPHLPSNHKQQFSDLRGMEYQDVDKFRTENNLQNIDSPLLYLKPSAPHKKFENFVTTLKSQSSGRDYEIYDDLPTTPGPSYTTTQTAGWDESRNDYTDTLPSNEHKEDKPKIVQIIVPYTTNKEISNSDDSNIFDEDYLPRKVPHPSENPYTNTVSESYITVSTTDQPSTATTDQYESILNDLYDVKEPPFDIVKLQHTIDDWTEQEYSKRTQNPSKSRENAKYAKKIPDEFFTTISPINNYGSNNFFEWYDHEGESSVINRSILKMKNDTFAKPSKVKDRFKSNLNNEKNDNSLSDNHKLHIYTAASSFRSTTTTQRPWDTIQTSISPLTKEKVYVVTSKPWLDAPNTTKEWFKVTTFDSSETGDDEISNYDDTLFKSPRFSKRPSYGFTSIDKSDSVYPDSSYGFSKNWHQKINNLDSEVRTTTAVSGSSQDVPSINVDELFDDTTTENPHKN